MVQLSSYNALGGRDGNQGPWDCCYPTCLIGDFLCEYAGDVISHSEAKEKEKALSAGRCYMYYFKYKGEALW